jgi:pimeloyl-ACP methyl ester carboxylesterase
LRKVLALTFMLSIVLVAQYMIWQSHTDVSVVQETIAGNPVSRYMAGPDPAGVVIVAHGFAGSKETMRPWGFALARQGFETYVIDQPGHGASNLRLPDWQGADREALGQNLRAIIDELVKRGRAQPGKIALVGHSMGGQAVTTAAMADDRVRATVAVSSAYLEALPTDRPGNMLSLAASRDPVEIARAVQAIAAQTGSNHGDFTRGTAREAEMVAGRNHMTIIFDAAVIDRTAEWIHAGLGTQPPARAPGAGWPWGWVAVALAGAFGAVLTCGAMLAPITEPRMPSGHQNINMSTALVTLAVTAFSAVLATVYLRIPWLGVAAADYLMPYFLVMAAVLMVLRALWPRDFGFPVSLGQEPAGTSLLRGAGIFLAFVGTFGPVMQMNLGHFMPTAPRILPMMALAVVFWLYFVQEEALKRNVALYLSPLAAVLVGLAGKLVIILTWMGANALPNPPIFLALITPVSLALLLGLELISFFLGRWRYTSVAIATFAALVLAWSVAITFPLV